MAKQQPLGQILVKRGLVKKKHVRKALKYQRNGATDMRLGEILVEFDFITQRELLECLGEQFEVEVVDLSDVRPAPEALESVEKRTATSHQILPLELQGNHLTIAMSDMDLSTVENLRFVLDMEITPVLAPSEQVERGIERHYGGEESTVDNMLREFTESEVVEQAGQVEAEREAQEEEEEAEEEEAPVARLVTLIINDAVRARASDIHVEPLSNRLRVRYRIDGVCQEVESPPKRLQGPILARLKLMAGMDLAEKRRPQDGRITMTVDDKEIDLRVSSVPITEGESIVLRILMKESVQVSLPELGFHEDDLDHFRRIISRPNGIFLVTGPTGSGKTTTLYCALNELNRPDTKIITAEDPVEYHISGINQTQVHDGIGRTFPAILRSMLRQAPEIILVGEMRDEETANIAIRAALTGHLVFSTLHTNDAPSALPRLMDMGIKPFMAASSVQAVMAQRLVRRICPKCKEQADYSDAFLHSAGLSREELEGVTLYRGAGCYRCNQMGYRGRMGIFELMEMSADLREKAFRKAPTAEIRKTAKESGMLTLREDGLRKALEGDTTLEEVMRVAGSAPVEA